VVGNPDLAGIALELLPAPTGGTLPDLIAPLWPRLSTTWPVRQAPIGRRRCRTPAGVEEPRALIHAPNESVDPTELATMAMAEALFLRSYAKAR